MGNNRSGAKPHKLLVFYGDSKVEIYDSATKASDALDISLKTIRDRIKDGKRHKGMTFDYLLER